jgi:hypothetical protein
MRNFLELTEAKGQIVFAFGRFNPPTTGHEKLITKTSQLSGSNPYRIYPSFSQNAKKDPLPHALKVGYMRKMFSKHARNIVADKDAKTAINVAVKLYDEGFTDLVMVVGSDRVKEFSSLLKTYNGVEGKRHGFYKFKTIDVVSAGERDPDAEGVEGMSASKMRAAAVEGDFESFQQGVPKGFKDAKKLYSDVRKYMGIREERHMGEMDEHEAVRDAYLTGKIWNVGDIVEANGVQGKVIRKGTNYIAFHDEDGKVHKAWLHEIDLDEALPKNLYSFSPEKYDSDKFFGGKGTPAQRTQLLKLQNKALKAFPSSPKQKEIQKEIQALRKKMGMKVKEEVDLDEALPIQVTIKDKSGKTHTTSTRDLRGATHALLIHYKEIPAVKGNLPGSKESKPPKTDIHLGTEQKLAKQAKHLLKKHPAAKFAIGAESIKLTQKMVKGATLGEELELDERNYANEYKNYHSKPEQIARRSSRNKARRAMGDKVKVGMDVGHKDNDPLNNEPDNLRNEDPSKNRREPRLREKKFDDLPSDVKTKFYKLYSKGMDLPSGSPAWKRVEKEIAALRKKYKLDEELSGAEKEKMKGYEKEISKKDFIDKYGKEEGERIYYATITKMAKENAEEIEESPITGILRKINQMTHPKQYDAIVKAYVKSRKDDPKKTTSFAVDKIVRQYSGIDVRSVIDYINKLIKKGVLPKDLAAEYHGEKMVREWYESETIREFYQEKYGDNWWEMFDEVHNRMVVKLGIGEDEFKPHMMYDPKTGKEYKADTYDDHIRMKKMGYVHEKPKMKENRVISFTNFRKSYGGIFIELNNPIRNKYGQHRKN